MLAHTYPHKSPRKIVAISNHQADSPLFMWFDVWSGDFANREKSMAIHDTKWPYWDQVLLNNTNSNASTFHCVYSLIKPRSRSLPNSVEPGCWPHWFVVHYPVSVHWYVAITMFVTLKVLNFWNLTLKWSGWISDSYCSLKPLWFGMGEVVPACTSPTLHPPSPPTVL